MGCKESNATQYFGNTELKTKIVHTFAVYTICTLSVKLVFSCFKTFCWLQNFPVASKEHKVLLQKAMYGKGGQDRINLRHQAIGMMMTGKSSREVGKVLGVDHSSVSRWYKRYQDGESLIDRKRSGRPTVQKKVSKLVLAKSLTKKRQSTRKLAERLSRSGHHMSHMTVHNYLTKRLGAKAFKCLKSLWSDKSPYALFAEGNSNNDVVWAKRVEEVEPIEKVKFSPKVMVWGAMTSHACLSCTLSPRKQA